MTQNDAILDYLQTGRSLTPLEALEKFNCFRLGARIWDLEKRGVKIKTEMVRSGEKTFARYTLDHATPPPVLDGAQHIWDFAQPTLSDRP